MNRTSDLKDQLGLIGIDSVADAVHILAINQRCLQRRQDLQVERTVALPRVSFDHLFAKVSNEVIICRLWLGLTEAAHLLNDARLEPGSWILLSNVLPRFVRQHATRDSARTPEVGGYAENRSNDLWLLVQSH